MAGCSGCEAKDKLLAKAADFLRDVFKLGDFKSDMQKKAVAKILTRENDVVICLPNGYGRVMSYLLPAAMRIGTQATIIIYSETDRAKAYYEKLKASAVSCQVLNEVTIQLNNFKILVDLTNGTIRPCLLYVDIRVFCLENVKRLFSFLREKNRLAYVVVDEIHGRQSWLDGKFIETYLKMGEFRRSCPEIPWIVVSSKVHYHSIQTLQRALKLKTDECGFKMFVAPVFKPSLYYECIVDDYLATSYHHLKDFVLQQLSGQKSTNELPVYNGSGLIFCKNKNICLEIITELQLSGIKGAFFSFGASLEEKVQMINSFNNGSFQVLTISHFAVLNIEMPNLRFVVHWGLPSSMMNYYHNTEVGGKGGHVTRCRMYVTEKSLAYYEENRELMVLRNRLANENEKQKHLIFMNALTMKKYCTSIQCRHAQIADYFGDSTPKCIDKCDICVAINKGFCALKKSSASSDETVKHENKIKSVTKKLADTKL